ncbi:class I SAM-dependent DNA methyltransferase [Kitasatospora sp. NPDC001540]|uniref:class I SAM-dependent DNA methyltransferase n=1 Tax=Kitasatospora sp. NPDC001540 TaxID=3364014 RepID=UPI0036AD071C
MSTVPTDHAAVAYDATAPFYDALTRQDDYTVFGDLLEQLIKRADPPGDRLLDAGCGTGRSTVAFARRGFRPTGTDISPAMIEIARATHADTGIDFHVHDIRLPFAHGGPYDVVLCMSDIVNYLADAAHLAEALVSLGRVMSPGGVLVFDANTRRGYRLMHEPHVFESEGLHVALRGRFLPEEGDPERFRLNMTAFRRSPQAPDAPETWTRESIDHLQRHHSVDEFTRFLDAAGLDLVAAHGLNRDGSLADSVDEDGHTKGLYVAVRRTAC